MAESRATGSAQAPSSSSSNVRAGEIDFEALRPLAVDSEDALGSRKVQTLWQKMYRAAKLNNPSETVQQSFRMAVYVYAAKNGTSREGNYSGEVTMSNGHTFAASIIPTSVGKMEIRKFFRGNMEESYTFLKRSKAMEMDERFVSKAAALGISGENAFAMADWLTDCPLFTPVEAAAHNKSFTHSISRARRAREGRSLEQVESARLDDDLHAQGPAVAGEFEGRSVF